MCTVVQFTGKNHYFGRNLDLEYHYEESVVVTPRSYPFVFRHLPAQSTHYAMIGMATVADGYPLYYEATNEYGLSMAGLNFPGSADYKPLAPARDNVAPFEFIPWVLGQCRNMAQARALLENASLLSENFSEQLPLSPLHWQISWQEESIVVESVADGLHVYDNPTGVMTNNPPFPLQLHALSNYMHLSPSQPENTFAPGLPLALYSNGMGGLGLPGDYSSASRFVRAAFVRQHSACGDSEAEAVSQFFHILNAVAMPRGSVLVHGRPEITVYSCCCNADTGVYYYTTYDNSRICGVDMHRENLDGESLVLYPLKLQAEFDMQN